MKKTLFFLSALCLINTSCNTEDSRLACEQSGGIFDSNCECPSGYTFQKGTNYCVDTSGFPGDELGQQLDK